MKRNILIISSFLISVILFLLLIKVEKSIVKADEYISVYALKDNYAAYSKIDMNNLDKISINVPESHRRRYITDVNILENKIIVKDYSAGSIILLDDLKDSQEIYEASKNNQKEFVSIPISSNDSALSNINLENRYINLYISINKELGPDNLSNYSYIERGKKENITLKYLDTIKPVYFFDKNGKKIINDVQNIYGIVLEVNKEEAIYLNYIKDKCTFNISIL